MMEKHGEPADRGTGAVISRPEDVISISNSGGSGNSVDGTSDKNENEDSFLDTIDSSLENLSVGTILKPYDNSGTAGLQEWVASATPVHLSGRLGQIMPAAEFSYLRPSSLSRNYADTLSVSTYQTAKSSITKASYKTPSECGASPGDSIRRSGLSQAHAVDGSPLPLTSWSQILKARDLIPNEFEEKNWSGRGQHAEFDVSERDQIPLKVERLLGNGAFAHVESVRCKRIRLARKTIRFHREMKREDAIKEVEHLQRLSHRHIVQLVGTYVIGRELCILMYPVAEYNLAEFLPLASQSPAPSPERMNLLGFFCCLANAIAYLHDCHIKHLDIKPQNILVRRETGMSYAIYIADFGIARSYKCALDAETEGPTTCTKKYAAPEVIMHSKRDFSVDIFSLGCVYLEIMAALLSRKSRNEIDGLNEIRLQNENGDYSYQANLPGIARWIKDTLETKFEEFPLQCAHCERLLSVVIPKMTSEDRSQRPSANALKATKELLHHHLCNFCDQGPEPFEDADLADGMPKDWFDSSALKY